MTLAIEPMVNAGNYRTKVLSDKWTVVTLDGSLSAHYENSLAITDGAAEILTVS
jgi:methionyl aminopeptidase